MQGSFRVDLVEARRQRADPRKVDLAADRLELVGDEARVEHQPTGLSFERSDGRVERRRPQATSDILLERTRANARALAHLR